MKICIVHFKINCIPVLKIVVEVETYSSKSLRGDILKDAFCHPIFQICLPLIRTLEDL